MEHNTLHLRLAENFAEEIFLRRLNRNRTDMIRLFGGARQTKKTGSVPIFFQAFIKQYPMFSETADLSS